MPPLALGTADYSKVRTHHMFLVNADLLLLHDVMLCSVIVDTDSGAFEMHEPCCDASVYCFTKRKPVFIPVNAFDSSEMELRVVLPDFEARPCAALITLLESNVMESCEPLTVA